MLLLILKKEFIKYLILDIFSPYVHNKDIFFIIWSPISRVMATFMRLQKLYNCKHSVRIKNLTLGKLAL